MPLYPQIAARNGRYATGSRARNAGLVPPYGGFNLIDALTYLGLTDGLKLCLDAGDAASYTSGQSWLDRSGNGHDFFLGADGSATATDPTFNGVAGGKSSSEYMSFDGGDYCRYDTTNETWMQNLHKDGAQFTVLGYFYPGSTGAQTLFGTSGTAAGRTGCRLGSSSGGQLQWVVDNAGASVTAVASGANGDIAPTAWNFFGVTWNENTGASGGILLIRNKTTIATSTYTSPAAGNATHTMEIGASGNANSPLTSGSRIGLLAVWEGVTLTLAQCLAFKNATRGRFGV